MLCATLWGSPLAFARRLASATSGVAALEFALILPVMLVLYVGGVEVTDGLAAKRKVSHAASAISDLVAQDTAIANTAEMQDIFEAGSAILTPFSDTPLKVAVIAIAMDANKKATVSWAQTLHGATCPAKGSVVTVPTALQVANGFLVLVKAVLPKSITIHDQLYQAPRSGKAIAGPTCS
jgi:Flp pilus assembly protein TadG